MNIPSFWSTIGTTIWWFLAVFLLISYLMVIFSIIGDVFRDRELGGLAKAIWVFFLVTTPVLTALVYLVVRGRGMGERAVVHASEARTSTEEYIRSVAGGGAIDEISRAKNLLDAGAITADEYATLKAVALRTTS
ncbi:SHOCT domain-containing protein [Sanguibacter sp. HDW7]|uniref:SHOCT domain-containing protein n=1 Tax=Sanguibacter sp. HDW7 TaxID=2714931 RepID=UPI0014076DA5|nr:SHOCT domain-containing protein [Sanguibacter sp. HDW7]QIK82448.1 SHOCT domain-containing protein [Sanguibacter sp. HDW7]